VLFLFPASADLSFLRFKTYSPEVVILFFGFFFSLFLGTIIIAHRMNIRQRKIESDAEDEDFKDNCKRFGLDATETEYMHAAVSLFPNINKNDIFINRPIYETAIHQFVEIELDKGVDPGEIDALWGGIRRKLHFISLPDGISLPSTRNISTGHVISLPDIKGEATLGMNKESCFYLKYTDNTVLRVNPGDKLLIAFARANDGLYAIDITVLEHTKGTIRCRHTATLKRNQLRKDVRMRVGGRVKLYFRDELNMRNSFDGKLVDISAGGICFESPIQIPEDIPVFIEQSSLPVQLAGVKCAVIATTERKKDEEVFYRYHGSFVGMPNEKKERIASYLFVKMRENQRN
jgi:hypothetical protein